MYRAGFTSRKAISKLVDETRRFLMDDLRAAGCSAIQLALINDIFAHYETDKDMAKTSAGFSASGEKETKFEEIVIPNRMRRWAADLSGLSAFFVPDQEMANVFAKEFDEATRKDPPFIPFAVPKSGD